MENLKLFFIRFTIPICTLAAIIIKVSFLTKRQEELLTQYDLYVFFLIFIISLIFSLKRKNSNRTSKKGGRMMNMSLTVLLRSLLYAALAFMVYDFVRVEQQFELMNRGYTDGFSVYINNWPSKLFIIITIILVLLNIFQLVIVRKNKNAKIKDYILPEYDVSDERSVEVTGKSVRIAFVFILIFSFFILGSYMFIPNYFLDYVWYPMFSTASIPIVGLIVYLISYKILYSR